MDIRRSYTLPFSPETVYAAWVSSATVIKPATSMDIDPVRGGHYRLAIDTEEFSARNEGRFLQVEPGRRLRYTWEWNNDGEVSEIDVTFSATAEGTDVEIHHSGFQKSESVTNHATGWDSYIAGLNEFLAKS